MKPYPKYKDSGVKWIGEVPEGWEKSKIKFCSDFINGYAFKSDDYVTTEGIPLIRIGDIKPEIDFNEAQKVPEEYAAIFKTFVVKKNDILVALTGATIGKSSVYKSTRLALLNQRVAILRPKGKTHNNFLKFFIDSDIFKKLIEYECVGGAQENIGKKEIGSYVLYLPKLLDQIQISLFLDRKTAQIDNLISKKQKLIELLKEERAAIINQAVTKGLNPDAPMKDSGIEWLEEVPEHWEVKRLKYIARITLGKMLTNVDKGGYHYRPYLRAQNINWEKVNVEDVKKMWFSKDELHQYRLNKNDLLVSEGGEAGRTAIWYEEVEECYIQNSVHKVTMKSANDPFFFLYTFRLYGEKGVFESVVSRISIAHLTKEKLKETVFPVPPNDEQERISKFISVETTKVEQTVSNIENQIELLQEYRTTLIFEVVTGKIDVRDEGSDE